MQPIYESTIEYLLENSESEGESEITADPTLKKIDINAATYDDWAQLGLLTPSQINAIIQHREKHGDFLSTYELSAVNGITETLLRQILPYLYVMSVTTSSSLRANKHELIAYAKNPFETDSTTTNLGSSYKLRTNYSFESSQLSVQMLTEKDEGETCFSSQVPTFDYTSVAVEYRPKSLISKIIAGDYTCQFGQGLVLWNRWDFSQNIYTANLCRIKNGIKMNRSFDENNFFRGIAVMADYNGWEITGWVSAKYRDATISYTDSNGRVLAVSNFQNSGLHATASQLNNRHSIREINGGAAIHREWKNIVLGVCGYQSYLSATLEPRPLPYLAYSFTGNQFWATSSYARLHTREAIFFAESAISNSLQNFAFIGGICYMPQPELTFNWLYRYYSPGYFSPYANAYAINTKVNNEEGYCFVLNYQYLEKYVTLLQFDFANFLWLRFGEKAPSNLNRIIFQQEYLSPPIKISVRYRYEWGKGNVSEEEKPTEKKQHRTTIQVWQQVRDNLSFRYRFDLNLYRLTEWSKGISIAQDIDWKLFNRFTLSGRYAVFSTDSWGARIYTYEKNIWRIYSSSMYYGSGIRGNLMLKWEISRKLQCWLRYSITFYSSRKNSAIVTPNPQAEASFQVYWRW
ncbi:MAG: ComEA family DNA-binding protein [Bacteroidales bacterium]